MSASSSQERLAKLTDQKKQITAQIARLQARQAAEKRKRDTRRKILAGAVILRLADEHPEVRKLLYDALDHTLRQDRDRQVFDLPVGAKTDE